MPVDESCTTREARQEQLRSFPNHGSTRVSLLNINSIDKTKFDYLCRHLTSENHSFVVLTELVQENSTLDKLLSQHDRFPILSHSMTKRVGLMTTVFL